MEKEKFNFFYKNGWVDINTLSPSENFYYQIQKPIPLNKAAFGCRIVFFSTNGTLLYNRNGNYAHELHSENEIAIMNILLESNTISNENPQLKFVKWSAEGNMAFFREYSAMGKFVFYEDVFINLSAKYCYRLDTVKDKDVVEKINPIEMIYSEKTIVDLLDRLGFTQYPLISDSKLKLWAEQKILKKWMPRM